MVTPFQQFRSQYPEGGLSADLISVHDGQYVVRAVLVNNGQLLVTSLASSVDVQVAEDKARDRALTLLGITPHSASESQTDALTQTAEAKSPTIEPTPAPTAMPTANSSTADATNDSLGPTIPEDEQAPPLPADEDMGPPIDTIAEEPVTTKPSAATIALENFSTSATPVDLSDVIAQTDVELTRLGWTNVQGREYLEKTYGKRSRQQLTDEELMSFLLYLEEQA
ncbi:MAG: hypothetical protein AAFQ95_12195 [Cyanobacteria bacterium J06621_3]